MFNINEKYITHTWYTNTIAFAGSLQVGGLLHSLLHIYMVFWALLSIALTDGTEFQTSVNQQILGVDFALLFDTFEIFSGPTFCHAHKKLEHRI